MKKIYLNVANIKILCNYNYNLEYSKNAIFVPFLHKKVVSVTDIELDINREEKIAPLITQSPDVSTPAWVLKKTTNYWFFDFYDKRKLMANLMITPDFTCGTVNIVAEVIDLTTILPVYILSMIIMNFLSLRNAGIIFHGSAISCGAYSTIFTGKSGVGKSTLSYLFDAEGYKKYGDDKLILTSNGEQTLCSSAPFDWKASKWTNYTGDAKFIFLLKHSNSKENIIREVNKEYIIKQIFYSNYIPFYLDNGVERNYKLLNNLLRNVLIYEYEFLPEKKSVHYLADFCEKHF